MGALRITLTVVLAIMELFLIVVVLLQESKTPGISGTISGGAETFFGKHKARSYEGKLRLLTKVSAIGFIVLAIVLSILQ
ncbi:preprotein translocase subunit SecG [Eubacteriales bacterium mix99]|jgi:preprotein translocase subunit SecG|nr:preprotein translocase subunit SecG [Clostridiales bacterium]